MSSGGEKEVSRDESFIVSELCLRFGPEKVTVETMLQAKGKSIIQTYRDAATGRWRAEVTKRDGEKQALQVDGSDSEDESDSDSDGDDADDEDVEEDPEELMEVMYQGKMARRKLKKLGFGGKKPNKKNSTCTI